MIRVIRLPVTAPQPERPKLIHMAPCKDCPSAHHAPDPEALDYLTYPRAVQVESCFPCAWRPQKLCKGYCDFLGVTEAELS